jgi:hypothetical protein
MAAQDANPPPWHVGLSDGCSAPFLVKWMLWLILRMFLPYCHRHDEKYHYGGTWSDKLKADDEFYYDIYNDGFWGRRCAGPVYWHIRTYTYNFPPDHSNRSWRQLTKGKAFNWLGKPVLTTAP